MNTSRFMLQPLGRRDAAQTSRAQQLIAIPIQWIMSQPLGAVRQFFAKLAAGIFVKPRPKQDQAEITVKPFITAAAQRS